MKKLLLTIAFKACCLVSLLAQPCLPEGIIFTTQTQIDNFQINYPGCTDIIGNVQINGEDITNLNGLNVIISFQSDLVIGNYDNGNPLLNTLSGLTNVSFIGGNLVFWNNSSLTNLDGLEGLTSIEGGLSFNINPLLNDITGLENVTYIGGTLFFLYNSSLISLTGLENISSIQGGLSFGHPVFLGNTNAISSLSGLIGLTEIGENLFIVDNDHLKSLSGLDNLMSVGGDLQCLKNDSLESLSGLKNILPASIIELTITNNPLLSICDVTSICEYLADPNGIVAINNNAPGCNSPEEVIEACLTEIDELVPTEHFSIYPNPISSTSFFGYDLFQPAHVKLQILDVSGQVIEILINEQQKQGEKKVVFDGVYLNPGVYFCVLKTNEGISTKKIIKL